MEDFALNIDWAQRDWVSIVIGIIGGIIIFFIGRWVAKLLARWVGRWMDRNDTDPMVTKFISTLVFIGLMVSVIIAALNTAGIHTTSLTALLASAGLAIGLALKDSLSNFASGVMILLFKPYEMNDFVEAGGTSGSVEEVSIFNTILHTPDNIRVIVPNGLVTSDVIKNFSHNETRRVDLVAGIGYEDNLGVARTQLMEMMALHELVLEEPMPTVDVLELADNSVNLAVRCWTETGDFWRVKSDLLQEMKERFDDNDINIPYPQQEVYVHQLTG